MRINALKNNNNISLVLGTRHYQFTGEKADKVFDLAMQYHKEKTEENLIALENEIAKINTIIHAGIVEEDGRGNYYLKGYRDVQMPEALALQIIEYAENDYPIDALVNFWKLCMANPNTQARDDFFDYVKEYGVTITDSGYAMLYKSVAREHEVDDELVNFVSGQYHKIKRWKKAPSKYVVIENDEGAYELISLYDEEEPENHLGDLQALHDDLDQLIEDTDAHYTPHHTGGDYGNKIQIGVPVTMPREECDPDINRGCSVGLHVGHRSYVKNFNFGNKKLILACLVNPMNVVALPTHDNSKMRTCEYYPYAVIAVGDEEWQEEESSYFEEDYCDYESEHIDEILANMTTHPQMETPEEEIVESNKKRLVDFYNK